MDYAEMNIASAENRNNQWQDALRESAQRTPTVYTQLRAVRNREELEGIRNRQRAHDAIESAIAVTPEGGALSPSVLQALNRDKGIETAESGEAVDGQVMDGRYLPNGGGYGFVVAKKQPDGSIGYVTQKIPNVELYGIMRNRPDLFTDNQVITYGQGIQKMNPSITDDVLQQYHKKYVARKQRLDEDMARMSMFGFGSNDVREKKGNADGNTSNREKDPIFNEIQELQKIIAGSNLTADSREAIRNRINELVSQHGMRSDKGTIKTGDNSGDANIPGYAPAQIAELKRRGYSWDGTDWVKGK